MGDVRHRVEPEKIKGLNFVTKIYAGYNNNALIDNKDQIFIWGECTNSLKV